MKSHLTAFAILCLTLSLANPVLSWGQETNDDPGRSTSLSETAVTVLFVNNSDAAMDLYWVDHAGKEHPYGRLARAETRNQSTGHGHLWRFKQNGRIQSFYQANGKKNQTFYTGGAPTLPVFLRAPGKTKVVI